MNSLGRRAIPLVGVSLVLAATVWALSFSHLPPADYTFCNGDEIKTIDPAIVSGSPEGRIIRALFEGLTTPDPKTVAPSPGVAERWDTSDDKLTYTFHLRSNALWSDGTPVTANDFAYSFRRFLHPAVGAEYAYEMWYVVGAEAYTKGQVEPGDPIEIELTDAPHETQPFPRGTIVRGKLVGVERSGQEPDEQDATAAMVYVVEVAGQTRRFQKEGQPIPAAGPPAEPCRWVLPDFEKTVAIQALDDRTLRIKLKQPVPYFLDLMGFFPMFPVQQKCIETYGYPLWTKPENLVGNGPYRLETRRIRDRIRLVKSDTYWDRDNVHLNVIDALAVKSETTMLNLYLTGQVDYIERVPSTVVGELLARPDFKPGPYLGTYFYRLNVTRPPLDNPRVRRALGLAIDKREIVERITRAGQAPARSFVPDEINKYAAYTPADCGDHDPDKARQLLAEAGFPGGRGFPTMEIMFNDGESHKAIAELVQSQWRQTLGIDVHLAKLEWAVYQSRQREMEYDASRSGWIGDYTDPNTFVNMFVTGGENNQTGWGNPEYDRLVFAAQREPDLPTRMREFHDAEQILMDEMPIIPIYYYVSMAMVRPYVHGFYPNVLEIHPYQGMSIDPEEKRRVLAEEGRH